MVMLLQQDDCAPDVLEYFCRDFKGLMNMSVEEFKSLATHEVYDEGRGMQWRCKGVTLEYHCEDPFYCLYAERGGN
jgi:hypothetical protein